MFARCVAAHIAAACRTCRNGIHVVTQRCNTAQQLVALCYNVSRCVAYAALFANITLRFAVANQDHEYTGAVDVVRRPVRDRARGVDRRRAARGDRAAVQRVAAGRPLKPAGCAALCAL